MAAIRRKAMQTKQFNASALSDNFGGKIILCYIDDFRKVYFYFCLLLLLFSFLFSFYLFYFILCFLPLLISIFHYFFFLLCFFVSLKTACQIRKEGEKERKVFAPNKIVDIKKLLYF